MKTLLINYKETEEDFYNWSGLTGDVEELLVPGSVAESDANLHDFLMDDIIPIEFDVIAIPVSVTSAYLAHTGIRLAMHLRLTGELGGKRYVPIILMGFESKLEVYEYSEYAGFLRTPNVHYVDHDVAGVREKLAQIETARYPKLTEEEFRQSLNAYPIEPPPHLESSHSLANEWGAAELNRYTVNIEFKRTNELACSLYAKLIRAKSNLTDTTGKKENVLADAGLKGKRILYIDDEWKKGWKEVMEKLFEKAEFKCLEIDKNMHRDNILGIAKTEIDKQAWDLILLDLRLSECDYEKSDGFLGEEILEHIKAINPVLPVIMFTASNKARTIDRLYEKGADGCFIKHGPSDSRAPDVVEESVKAFLKAIETAMDKGSLLLPYWKRIQGVREENLVKGNERETPDGKTNFEGRIIERLEMFVGLLKKAYEQTAFEKKRFYYDQYEVAFLTLWSCLNEIVDIFYERTQPEIEVEGRSKHDLHKDKPAITYPLRKFKWVEVFGQEIYADHGNFKIKYPNKQNSLYNLESEEYSILEKVKDTQGKDKQYFKILDAPIQTKTNYQITLINQVAFLVYAICKKYKIEAEPEYWKILEESNNLRNCLCLIHNELLETKNNSNRTKLLRDESSTDQKRWRQKIAQLFNLVEFMLTARKKDS